MNAYIVEVSSPLQAQGGDAAALAQLELPRAGDFGCVPGVPWEHARGRSDAFLHLVATIWPGHSVQGEPEEDGAQVIH